MTNWKHKLIGVNVAIRAAHSGECTYNEAIAKIGDIVAKTSLYKTAAEQTEQMRQTNDQEDLVTMVEEMRYARENDEAIDRDYFEAMLHGLYDWADRETVWIEPLSMLA